MSAYSHRRAIDVRPDDPPRGWFILAAVERAVHEMIVARGEAYDVVSMLMHDYGDDADYEWEPGKDCVAMIERHVLRQTMRTYGATLFWDLGDEDRDEKSAASIYASLDVDPDSEYQKLRLSVSVSSADAGMMTAAFDPLWRAVETGRTSEIEPIEPLKYKSKHANASTKVKKKEKGFWDKVFGI